MDSAVAVTKLKRKLVPCQWVKPKWGNEDVTDKHVEF